MSRRSLGPPAPGAGSSGREACFIVDLGAPGAGRPVAVKDLIDVSGLPTTAGCRAVAEDAAEVPADADCLGGIRRAEAAGELHLVGKTNLHELAFGITGINPWYGTPANPLDPNRVPGGSSSGSAVAIARGWADLALGTDTGGSIRIPAACCGIAGLKTTVGRISVRGIRPLAPTLDTVGPLAADVAGLVWGMQLLEPGFDISSREPPPRIGRFRISCSTEIDTAIDDVLARAGFDTLPVELAGWERASQATMGVIAAEAFDTDGHLLSTGRLGDDVAARLVQGGRTTDRERAALRSAQAAWKLELAAELSRAGVIAMPTLSDSPPLLEEAAKMYAIRQTHPVNLAGVPALTLPVPSRGAFPASLQLIGPAGSEELLLAAGIRLEAAARV